MSHTYIIDEDGIRFHYDPDLSGLVTIVNKKLDMQMTIKGSDLIKFFNSFKDNIAPVDIKQTIVLLMNNDTDRERLVLALVNCGYEVKVRSETKVVSTDFYIEFKI